MRSLLVILLFAGIGINLGAQSEDNYTRYKFYKKNGSYVIGQIVEKSSEGPYRIQLDNGVIVEIKEQEILRFRPLRNRGESGPRRTFNPPTYKWGISTDVMGVNNGIRNIGNPGISTGASLTVQRYLNSNMSAGIGMGVYNYDIDARRMIMPLYGELKIRAIRHSTSPVIILKSGYGWAAKNYLSGLQEHKGGAFINPFLGYEFGIDRKISWTFGIGFLFQKAYYSYSNGQESLDEDIYFKRTEFKLGITIH